MNRVNDPTRTVWLAVGAGLLGASIALLLAPQSGKRTRRDLRRLSTGLSRKAEDFYDDLSDRLEDLVATAEEIGSKGLEKGKETSEKLQEDLVRRLEAGKDLIAKQVTRVENLRKAS